MKLADKLVVLGNQFGKDISGDPQGIELLRCFVNSSELPNKARFKVETNKGIVIFLIPKKIREILVTDIPWNSYAKGRVGRREAAIALLKWRVV
jgi:hypothetical protein